MTARSVHRYTGRSADAGIHLGEDGSNFLTTATGAPVSGAAGSFAGFAPPGSLLTDVSTGRLYINTDTLVSPTWTMVDTPPYTPPTSMMNAAYQFGGL
jgi:hypothetical protein